MMIKKKIRIISGKLRHRNIITIANKKIRPTKNIIKETIFNWLSNKIINSKCLDCFAGSGSLGIEAISRNAKSVTFLEKNKKILENIKNNIKKLKIKNVKLINTDTISWLKKKMKNMI